MVDKGWLQTEIHYIEGVVQWDIWGLVFHLAPTNISVSSAKQKIMKMLMMFAYGTSYIDQDISNI